MSHGCCYLPERIPPLFAVFIWKITIQIHIYVYNQDSPWCKDVALALISLVISGTYEQTLCSRPLLHMTPFIQIGCDLICLLLGYKRGCITGHVSSDDLSWPDVEFCTLHCWSILWPGLRDVDRCSVLWYEKKGCWGWTACNYVAQRQSFRFTPNVIANKLD